MERTMHARITPIIVNRWNQCMYSSGDFPLHTHTRLWKSRYRNTHIQSLLFFSSKEIKKKKTRQKKNPITIRHYFDGYLIMCSRNFSMLFCRCRFFSHFIHYLCAFFRIFSFFFFRISAENLRFLFFFCTFTTIELWKWNKTNTEK